MSSPASPTPLPIASTEPARPAMSQLSRIFSMFYAPSKTFADVRIKASWWAPWVFASIFSLAFGFTAVQKLDMRTVVQQQIDQSKMAQRQMEQMSPEQREHNIAIRASITKVVFFVFPVFALIGGIVMAAVLMAVFNFGFAAEVPFDRALAIVFYSFIPGIIVSLLGILTFLTSSDLSGFNIKNPVATNPAFFMDPLGNKFLYALATRVDIIAIWILILMGLGFATVSKRKLAPATAIITMAVIYGVYALAAAGLGSAF